MLRVVLDTNVWLDWLVFDDPSVAPIKAMAAAGHAGVFLTADCEAELERALGYDLSGRSVDVEACMVRCRAVARRVDTSAEGGSLPACRDRDDQKFLEAALAARAGFLVTKDHALLDLAKRVTQFRIVLPAEFARVAREAAGAEIR